MRELPILFSTPMVRAILDGHKTMTRRVMKPAFRNHRGFKQGDGLWIDGYKDSDKPNAHIKDYSVSSVWWPKDSYIKEFAPYKPGDKLWVRETWQCVKYDSMDGDLSYGVEFKDGTRKYFEFDDNERYHQFGKFALKEGWQPSIYLPKEAARIWLEIVNVRVERLQEITEEDARAEGCIDFHDKVGDGKFDDVAEFDLTAKDAFIELWDSLNAKRGYGWEVNPWVWVIEFHWTEGRGGHA